MTSIDIVKLLGSFNSVLMARKATTKKASTKKAPKKSSERRLFRVFYRELTAEGRTGATAHRDFTSEKEARAFADETQGRVV